MADLLGLPIAHVRVITRFVGGGFGAKAMVWPNVTLIAMAARYIGRPVKLMLTRPQMFTSNGHREEQEQWIAIGATRNGRLTAIRHEKLSITSPFDDWAEPATGVSLAALRLRELPRRAPADPGQHDDADVHPRPGRVARRRSTLEMAIDELAYELAIDPLELRLRNHTPVDPFGNPWSSDGLVECLRLGAETFGWSERIPAPRHGRDGELAARHRHGGRGVPDRVLMPPQRARARILADGSAIVQTSTQEFGTGVLDHGHPGRRRRARRRPRRRGVPGRRQRPAEQYGGSRIGRCRHGQLRGPCGGYGAPRAADRLGRQR